MSFRSSSTIQRMSFIQHLASIILMLPLSNLIEAVMGFYNCGDIYLHWKHWNESRELDNHNPPLWNSNRSSLTLSTEQIWLPFKSLPICPTNMVMKVEVICVDRSANGYNRCRSRGSYAYSATRLFARLTGMHT